MREKLSSYDASCSKIRRLAECFNPNILSHIDHCNETKFRKSGIGGGWGVNIV